MLYGMKSWDEFKTTVLVWTRRFDFIQKSSSGDLRGSKTYHRDIIKPLRNHLNKLIKLTKLCVVCIWIKHEK
jgi:hypothetical protein